MKIKSSGRTTSVPMGIAVGLTGSITLLLLLSAIIAWIIGKGILDYQNIGYAVMIMLLATSVAGSAISYGKIKRRKLMVCIISGVSYFVFLLLITALFFGAQYTAVGETALLIFCGSIIFALVTVPSKTNKRRKYRRLPS